MGPVRLARRPHPGAHLCLSADPPGRGSVPDSPGRPNRPRRRL